MDASVGWGYAFPMVKLTREQKKSLRLNPPDRKTAEAVVDEWRKTLDVVHTLLEFLYEAQHDDLTFIALHIATELKQASPVAAFRILNGENPDFVESPADVVH